MGKLVEGDDGLPVDEVGSWAKEKHGLLCRYVDITRAVRSKWLTPNGAGATYIDIFCGPGRAKIQNRRIHRRQLRRCVEAERGGWLAIFEGLYR